MKLRALIALAAAALVTASAAAAATQTGPGPGQGKGAAHGGHAKQGATGQQACSRRPLLLRGLYVSGSAGTDGAGSFVLTVKRHDASKQVTVTVDSKTMFRRGGPATLADLQANDRVGVLARACKAATGSDAPEIVARLVVARAPAATG